MLYQITKDAFEKLSEDLKKEYNLDGEKATLKLEGEGAPSVEALVRAEDKLRIEREHRKKAEDARDAAEAASEKLRNDLDKASGKEEIARVKAEHQAELEKIRAEREAEKAETAKREQMAMIKDAAGKFAKEHFIEGVDEMVAEQFGKRLSIEVVNGQNVIRPLGPDGKPSVLSLTELQTEFLENKKYSSIIKSKAGSGGGANPSNGGGAPKKSLAEMSATEEAAFANANPEEYAKLIGVN